MSQPPAIDWSSLEDLIRHDPAGRGVAGFRADGQRLGDGQLEAAARSLVSARGVCIVTGFGVYDGERYVAETDGPPGALALAEVLLPSGAEVALVSDSIGLPALTVGREALNLGATSLHEFPFEDENASSVARQSNEAAFNARSDAWVEAFLASDARPRVTHLVAIERVGPSHTLQSIAVQVREDFQRDVPAESRNVCHNMRGEPINGSTAKTHRLFEIVRQRKLPITTIGIGDGGNEIGMGQFSWEVLRAAIACGPAGSVACRIATDLTILAGVSNWGGYALAAAVARLNGHDHFLDKWNAQREQQLLQTLVEKAHCVDGLTRRREATVDGLSVEASAAFWQGIAACGLAAPRR
jgi:hypothetical protein